MPLSPIDNLLEIKDAFNGRITLTVDVLPYTGTISISTNSFSIEVKEGKLHQSLSFQTRNPKDLRDIADALNRAANLIEESLAEEE